jgi:hypothetical protein
MGLPLPIPPPDERRTHLRFRLASLAYLKFGDGNGGIATDASEGGLQITSAQVLRAGEGSELSIQIDIGENLHSIDVIGRTIWLSGSHKTAGIQFLSLTDDARRQIQGWIARDARATDFALRRSVLLQSSAPPSESLEKLFPPEAHEPPAAETPQPFPASHAVRKPFPRTMNRPHVAMNPYLAQHRIDQRPCGTLRSSAR